MGRKSIFLILGVLILIGAGVYILKYYRIGRFVWYDNVVKKEYQKLSWQAGNFSAVGGLEAKYEAKEKRMEKCATEEELNKKDYLRVEGGMCPTPVKLFITDKGKEKNVGDATGLLSMLGKINNVEKAVTLVFLTTSDVQRNSESLILGRATKTNAGYLVEYTVRNTFGCGVHQPTKKIVLVTENGVIQLIASEKENPFSGLEICVD